MFKGDRDTPDVHSKKIHTRHLGFIQPKLDSKRNKQEEGKVEQLVTPLSGPENEGGGITFSIRTRLCCEGKCTLLEGTGSLRKDAPGAL